MQFRGIIRILLYLTALLVAAEDTARAQITRLPEVLGEDGLPLAPEPGLQVELQAQLNSDGWGQESVVLQSPYEVDWSLQILPDSLIYRSYLAGRKEPRFAGYFVKQTDGNLLWEGDLGTRIGLWRYGSRDRFLPQGWQMDIEGAAMVRLDTDQDVDVQSVDFRAGVPITFGWGRHQTKLGYYHLSSHLGDEFLLKNMGFARLNFARDVLILGHSVYATDWLRLYAETGWAFYNDVSKPWEFQFGIDWASPYPTGIRGAPFFAANAHLREEVDFGGNFTVQFGWSWRDEEDNHLFRIGAHYFNGKSSQFSFFNFHEEITGLGVWYDF